MISICPYEIDIHHRRGPYLRMDFPCPKTTLPPVEWMIPKTYVREGVMVDMSTGLTFILLSGADDFSIPCWTIYSRSLFWLSSTLYCSNCHSLSNLSASVSLFNLPSSLTLTYDSRRSGVIHCIKSSYEGRDTIPATVASDPSKWYWHLSVV